MAGILSTYIAMLLDSAYQERGKPPHLRYVKGG